MARRLLIAGIDRWPDYIKDSLQIEAVLTYQIDSAQFRVRGAQPSEGDEVIIEDDALGRLFAGIIVKVDLVDTSPDRTEKVWQVECDDYTAMLDRRLVVETYQNMAADAIFRDIAAKYCPGFTVNGVRSGAPVVEELIFDYKPPSECFKELCDYVGWQWQVTYFKDLQFFNAEELGQPAPMTLEPGGYFRNLKHTIDKQGLRNRVYVRGGTMLSDPWTYEVKADGSARAWVLPHKPHDLTLTVGGVAKTVGIENVDDEATKDFLMNYEEKYVRCSAQTPTPAAGTTMSFTYRYDIDVITMVEDIASQQAIAAVQGGDGVYEHVIVDDSLTTIDAAEAAGNADLREHANPQVKGSFETEVNGWQPGQLVTINLPDRGVTGTFLVQKVTITPVTPDKWTYRVEYGGRLLGIADWLQALWKAQQKKQLNQTALLHKFHYGAETAKVTDEVQGTLRTPPWVVEEGQEILVQPVEIAPVEATFSRSSVAYLSDGTQVAANVPRFEPGRFGNAIMVEEGTTNLALFTTISTWVEVLGNNSFKFKAGAPKYALYLSTGTLNLQPNTDYIISYEVFIPEGATCCNVQCDLYPDVLPEFDNDNIPTGQRLKYSYIFNSSRSEMGSCQLRFFTDNQPVYPVANDIYIYNIQLEQKSYATSYITPNTTRSPELLTIPTAGVLNPQEGTVEFWVNLNTLNSRDYNAFFTSGDVSGPGPRILIMRDIEANHNKIMIWDGDGSTESVLTSLTTLQVGVWYYVAFTWSPSGRKLYVNGVLEASNTRSNSLGFATLAKIGSWWSRGYLNGLIDDLRISSRARTDEEIADAYASNQPLPVDEWTTCKLNFDGTLAFPGGVIAVERQLQTVGSLLSLTAPAQIATSFDGQDWTEYQDAEKYIEVPYPGYVKVKPDKRTWVYNWKKPFVETDTVCGFVVCG